MKFISFVRCGEPGFGAMVEGGLVDLTGRLAPDVKTLKAAIARGLLDEAKAYMRKRDAEFALSDVTLLPVIPDPAKILCIGLNYESHRLETKRPEAKYPAVFPRYADTQIGHGQPIVKPRVSDALDYEAELAVIIGRGGRDIAESAALDHVAGYACYNDVSVRDWQRHTHQFMPGKNFPATGPFGPQMVTPDEVGDYRKLPIVARLNGVVMQEAQLDDLIFTVPDLIAYCSQFTALMPGDVIITGTPGGVGDRREPPVYMKPGDVIEIDLGIVGKLVNPVIAEE